MHDGRWPGLEQQRLEKLEMEWCAHLGFPDWQSRFASGPITTRAKRCSFMFKHVWQACKKHAARSGAKVPSLAQLGPFMGNPSSTSGTCDLLGGKLDWSTDDPTPWCRCENLLKHLLLGNSGTDAKSDDRRRIADRIVEFFFESSADELPIFFTQTLDSECFPRPIEGAYDMLGLFHNNPEKTQILSISGGTRFSQIDDGILTPLGEATIAVAARGVNVHFVYPDPLAVGRTPALDSLDSFFRICQDGHVLTGNDSVFSGLTHLAIDKTQLKTAAKRIVRSPCDPTMICTPSSASRKHLPKGQKKIWAASFLNPICKFIYYDIPDQAGHSRLHVSRLSGGNSFAFQPTDEEVESFLLWRKTVPAKLKCESVKDWAASK